MDTYDAEKLCSALHSITAQLEDLRHDMRRQAQSLETIAEYMPALCEHVGNCYTALADIAGMAADVIAPHEGKSHDQTGPE